MDLIEKIFSICDEYYQENEFMNLICDAIASTENDEEYVSLSEKILLTLNEAAKLFGIGINHLRDMTNDDNCGFVCYVGRKRMIKRRQLEDYLSKAFSI